MDGQGKGPTPGAAPKNQGPSLLARPARHAGCILVCMLLVASCIVITPLGMQAAILLRPRELSSAPASITSPGAQSAPSNERLGGASRAGCVQTSTIAEGTSANRLVVSGGHQRSYRLHVPTNYNANVLTPLVLAFHGDGGSGADLEAYTGLSTTADASGFLVAYPDGMPGAENFTTWGEVGIDMPAVDDVQFVSDLIDQLSLTYCVDASRIYATGFSRGGGMTALLACSLSDRIAAFAPVSGSFFSSIESGCAPSRPVPILDFHGSADDVVPYDGGGSEDFLAVPTWLADWAVRDGCALGPQPIDAPSGIEAEQWIGCSSGSTVIHYLVMGAGHIWPGGSGEPQPIDAASVIWSFLQHYSLPQVRGKP